jgi:5-enolpyruvylshikimate-3-phosphate synthase
VDASRSSQFLSALLLVRVAVEEGSPSAPKGTWASSPYVETTLEILEGFGPRRPTRGGRDRR